jgi:predicted nucleic acid-binding Zn ribbon protein
MPWRDPESPRRRSRPDRLGDLLPEAARRLGLEDELRLARAIVTWHALVAERVPPATGACRLVALEADTLVVAADEPIVAAELRMRATELLAAFAAAPGGTQARFLRLVGADAPRRGGPTTRV